MRKHVWSADTPNLTVGMDLGDSYADLCLLDGRGSVVGRERVRTRPVALEARFRELPPARVVLEVGTHSPWVSRLLEGVGHEVIVANPGQMERRRRKNNRLDAEHLARQGSADPALLAPVQHRGERAQTDLALVRARDVLVRSRTRLITSVRGAVKAVGARLSACSADAFAARSRGELPEALSPALVPLLEVIAEMTRTIRGYDAEVERRARERYPETERLRQVAGVGALTALAYVLVLEDAARFPRSRAVGSYLGLCPALRETGEEVRDRRISKSGDELLRRLLVQSAHYILGPFGPECELRRFGLRLAARGGKAAKKRAAVAVARKLAVLLHRLWGSGAAYEPLRAGRGDAGPDAVRGAAAA